MAASEQWHCLKSEVKRGNGDNSKKGSIVKHLRKKRSEMKLEGLFAIDKELDETFMNIELREFLNTHEDGGDSYTWPQVNKENSGWWELPSRGAEYHQFTAPTTKAVVGYNETPNRIIPVYDYNRLNAKFCHTDGREAVFSYEYASGSEKRGIFVSHFHDKGTFNYDDGNCNFGGLFVSSFPIVGRHDLYDIQPFKDHIRNLQMEDSSEGSKKFCRSNLFAVNSSFWKYG